MKSRRQIYGCGDKFTVPGDEFMVDSPPNGGATKGPTGEGNAQAILSGAGHLVTKHNDLVQASYSLTLDELRLVLMAVSKIDPRPEVRGRARYLQEQHRIFISAHEFASIFQLDKKNAYRQLRGAAGRLWEVLVRRIDRPLFALAGHIDAKLAIIQSVAIEPANRLFGLSRIGHLDEAESALLPRISVSGERNRLHCAYLGKQIL